MSITKPRITLCVQRAGNLLCASEDTRTIPTLLLTPGARISQMTCSIRASFAYRMAAWLVDMCYCSVPLCAEKIRFFVAPGNVHTQA